VFSCEFGRGGILHQVKSSTLQNSVVGKECVVNVNQKPFMEQLLSNNVVIQCTFTNTSGCMGDPDILWFRLSDTKAIKLDTTEVTQQKFCLDGEVSKGFASLQIYNTNHNDSGIYYCGVSFLTKDPTDKSKQTGGGTILLYKNVRYHLRLSSHSISTSGNISATASFQPFVWEPHIKLSKDLKSTKMYTSSLRQFKG
uniref:Ig-like domain-containing protein n=1 Tax=Callorhinchus milii TaxID=7868 RepID=A0A4W3HZU4_CALMI